MAKRNKIIALSATLIFALVLGAFILNIAEKPGNIIPADISSDTDNVGNATDNTVSSLDTESGEKFVYYQEELINESLESEGLILPNNIFLDEQGRVLYMSNSESHRYTLFRDDTPLLHFDNYDNIYNFAIDNDKIYLAYIDEQQDIYFDIISMSGELLKEKTKLKYPQKVTAYEIYYLRYNLVVKDGIVYCVSYSDGEFLNIFGFSEDGDIASAVELGTPASILGFDLDNEGNFYSVTPATGSEAGDGKPVLVFFKHDRDGKLISKFRGHKNRFDPAQIIYSESGLYFANKDELVKLSEEGVLEETVLTFGDNTSFYFTGDTYSEFGGFCTDGEDTFYVGVNRGGKSRALYKYTKTLVDKLPEKQYATELVITTGFVSQFLGDVIKRYSINNPDVKITVDSLYDSKSTYAENSSAAKEKYAVKIMTGDIGDVAVTAGMGIQYSDMFKTDAFMDLTQYIEDDKNYDVLNKAVLNGITIDGAIRGLPIGHMPTTVYYNKELGDSLGIQLEDPNNIKWSQIFELAKKLEKEHPTVKVFGRHSERINIIVDMLIANMPDLVDWENKEVNLKQDFFIALLEDLKEVIDSPNFLDERDPIGYKVEMILGSNGLFKIYDFKGHYNHEIYWYGANGQELMYIPKFVGEKNENRVSYTTTLYSISNLSQKKDEAWKFLSYMLEDEIQSIYEIESAVTNQQSEYNLIEYFIEFYQQYYTERLDIPEARIHEDMRTITESVDFLYDMGNLKDDIYRPLEAYLKGTLSLEKALDTAEYNLTLRLNE